MRTREFTKSVQDWKAELLGRPVTVDEVKARFPEIGDPEELVKIYEVLTWKHPEGGWVW